MKYLAAVSVFIAVHLVFLYLYWLGGNTFERSVGMFGVFLRDASSSKAIKKMIQVGQPEMSQKERKF